jgi:hypothetical protein
MDRTASNTRAATGRVEQDSPGHAGDNPLTVEWLNETEGEFCAKISSSQKFSDKERGRLLRMVRARFRQERENLTINKLLKGKDESNV